MHSSRDNSIKSFRWSATIMVPVTQLSPWSNTGPPVAICRSYGALLFYLNLSRLVNLETCTSYNSFMIYNYILNFKSYPKGFVENDAPDCYFVLFWKELLKRTFLPLHLLTHWVKGTFFIKAPSNIFSAKSFSVPTPPNIFS